jgi:hypothetical protein
MKYKNIEFDLKLLENDSKNIHEHNLKIVAENLSEFNRRNPEEQDIKYKYHARKSGSFEKKEFVFDRINETGYSHYSDFYFTPNWFIYISRNTVEFPMWVEHYCERVFNSFHKQMNLFGKKEIDLFIVLFKDFCPKGGFLSTEQELKFKSIINDKCRIAKSYC